MVNASPADKYCVVDILTKAFEDNKSVNYIIKQDQSRRRRIKRLMEYSFDVCRLFGEVLLSDDKRACALIVWPEKKRISLKSVLLDIKLMVTCIGLSNIKKALVREAKIKKLQPKEPVYYLWFIGVDPLEQHSGIGSRLLREIIERYAPEQRAICLETSTLRNIPWYQRFGFELYNELDLGYTLYFLKK